MIFNINNMFLSNYYIKLKNYYFIQLTFIERGGSSFCSFARYLDNQALSSFSYFPDMPIILDNFNLTKQKCS